MIFKMTMIISSRITKLINVNFVMQMKDMRQ